MASWLRSKLAGGAGAAAAPEPREERWDVEQAHDAAVREVAALLAKPENLGRLGKIKAEYEAQRLAVQVQISMLTGRKAEEARAGIDMLVRCRGNIAHVIEVKERLVDSINTSEKNLPQYPALRRAWVVRRNLERTITDLDAILVMPMELARIEAELNLLSEGAAPSGSDDSASSGSSDHSASGGESSEGIDDTSGGRGDAGQEEAGAKRSKKRKASRADRRANGVSAGGQLDVDKSLPGVHKSLLQLERR
jgi:hypothetical protein